MFNKKLIKKMNTEPVWERDLYIREDMKFIYILTESSIESRKGYSFDKETYKFVSDDIILDKSFHFEEMANNHDVDKLLDSINSTDLVDYEIETILLKISNLNCFFSNNLFKFKCNFLDLNKVIAIGDYSRSSVRIVFENKDIEIDLPRVLSKEIVNRLFIAGKEDL